MDKHLVVGRHRKDTRPVVVAAEDMPQRGMPLAVVVVVGTHPEAVNTRLGAVAVVDVGTCPEVADTYPEAAVVVVVAEVDSDYWDP